MAIDFNRCQVITPQGQHRSRLYDMLGNVVEWCNDWYGKNYYFECKNDGIVTNPTGPGVGTLRILRGGGWTYQARRCYSAARERLNPGFCGVNVGFRVVLSP